METYARFLVRHAWAVLIALTIATVGVGSGLRDLRAEFNVEASLPAEHPLVQIDRNIRKTFGGRNTILVAIRAREGDIWQPAILEAVRSATLDALRLDDVIAQNVVSLAAPGVRWVEERDGRIDVDYLMRDVPQTPEGIAALRARVEADPQLRSSLVTPDQRAALLAVDFWDGPPAHVLAQRMLDLTERVASPAVEFFLAGEPMLALTDLEQSHEMTVRIPFTFLAIAILLLLSFGNLQGMLIPMLTAALSVVWGLGLMGHTGLVMDTWNMGTPILLIAIAAGHSAQMLKRYTEEVARLGDNRAAVVASTVAMGPVLIAAGGVATLGFASLALTRIPAIVGFGLSCAYGIASAVLLEMTFIPALRAVLPAPKRQPKAKQSAGRILGMLERAILERGGRRVWVGVAVALVLAIVGLFQIRTYGSTREYLARDSLPRRHLEEIDKHFPGTVTMTVLYEGPQESAKRIEVLRHMDGLQTAIAGDPLVWRTASMVDLVKMLHKTFNPDAPDPYRLPDDQELVAQLLFLGDSPAFERFVDRSQSRSLIVAQLRDDDPARVGPLLERARAWVEANPPPAGVQVLIAGGVGPTILAITEHVTRSKLLNILLVLSAIWLVSSVMLRSVAGGLFVVAPLAVTVVCLFGAIGWLGIRLDIATSTILAMAAGIGADYAIYFLSRLREERIRVGDDAAAVHAALVTSGRAVIFVATAIGSGFLVMGLFSRFFGLRLFATLMPLAMVFSCVASLSLIPVLVLWVRPAFVFGHEPDPSVELSTT